MPAPDFFSQLPSFEELLSHPRVTAAVERLNRSSAATRVRTAFAELAGEATRRADELAGLSPAELVDRFVGRIERAAQSHEPAGGAVNATGTIRAAGFVGARLPAAAVSAAAAVAGGGRRLTGRADCAVVDVIGCDAACALVSHAAALRAALESVARGGVVIVARMDMHSLVDGGRIDRLIASVGAELVEVGAADAVSDQDYSHALAAVSGRPAVVLLRPSAGFAGVRPSARDIAKAAKTHGATMVCDLGGGPLRRDTPLARPMDPSAEACLADGAGLVVIDASGATGGPIAGVLAGTADLIRGARASEAASESRIDPMTEAALEATVRLFRDPERLRFTHPRFSLLDTPGENLRLRAERLAQLLESSPAYESVEAVSLESADPAIDEPTWGVRLHPTESGFAERLASGDPAVAVRQVPDGLVIDLRTVFPGEDATLSRVLGGESVREDDVPSDAGSAAD